MPAAVAVPPFGSNPPPSGKQIARQPARRRNCTSKRGFSESMPTFSSTPTASRARKSAAMNTGTDSIGATCAASPVARWAARMTRLPVIWAVNNPPRPRKLITSMLPATRLKTAVMSFSPVHELVGDVAAFVIALALPCTAQMSPIRLSAGVAVYTVFRKCGPKGLAMSNSCCVLGPLRNDRSSIRRRRLLFRSWHRGTQESDLILGKFADAHLVYLDSAQLERFEALLDCSDADLFGWIIEGLAPPRQHDHDVMRMLREFCAAHQRGQ